MMNKCSTPRKKRINYTGGRLSVNYLDKLERVVIRNGVEMSFNCTDKRGVTDMGGWTCAVVPIIVLEQDVM